MDNTRTSSLVVTVAIAAGTMLALTGAISQQKDTPTQFGAAVNRVLVDVTVLDNKGRFVPDLTIENFEILEEGQPVDLSFFALERFRKTLPVRATENGEVPQEEQMPLELAEAALLPRYMVLFIDGFNTSPPDWDNVRYALNDYLDKHVQENDRLLLATLTPNRKLLVGPEFTQDVNSLKRLINELVTNPAIKERERQNKQDLLALLYDDSNQLSGINVAGESIGSDPQGNVANEANILRQGANLADVFAGQRKNEILYTLNSMTSLAEHLSRTFDVPGPKTMIMVSGGISENPGSAYYYILDARLDQASAEARVDAPMAAEHPVAFRQPHAQTIDTYLERAVGHLNRMNYTLYTIGARGTMIGAFDDASDRFRSNLSPGISSIAYRDEEVGLEILSRGTGGLAFHNSANFFGAFERIDHDTAFRYVLGYTPPERADNANPDKFYRIQVKVDRKNVNVRARRGYVGSY